MCTYILHKSFLRVHVPGLFACTDLAAQQAKLEALQAEVREQKAKAAKKAKERRALQALLEAPAVEEAPKGMRT